MVLNQVVPPIRPMVFMIVQIYERRPIRIRSRSMKKGYIRWRCASGFQVSFAYICHTGINKFHYDTTRKFCNSDGALPGKLQLCLSGQLYQAKYTAAGFKNGIYGCAAGASQRSNGDAAPRQELLRGLLGPDGEGAGGEGGPGHHS